MPSHGSLIYDPLQLDADPYPAYRRLRNEAPLYAGRCAAGPFHALSRFEDVRAAARDFVTFSSAHGNDLDDTGRLFGDSPAMDLADPPVHTRQRSALRHAFSREAMVDRLEPIARQKVHALVERLKGRDRVDFAEELAYPLPAELIGGWLGFPAADFAQIGRWHAAMLDRTPGRVELPSHAVSARDEMWAYIRAALADRRRRPLDDLLSALAQAQNAGELSDGEALANAVFFFDAGIVSTAALIGNSLLHLRDYPSERQLLREHPELIPSAIEELLRFDAPFHWFVRVTTREVRLHDRVIPPGARVVLIWASANRDERCWDAADRLVLTRTAPVQHLSFSAGIHQCLGAPLARMEVRLLFELLLPLLDDYEIDGPVVRRITPSERTIIRLPARVKWAY